MDRFSLPAVDDVSLELMAAETLHPKLSAFPFTLVPLTCLGLVVSTTLVGFAFSEGTAVHQEGLLTAAFIGFGVSAVGALVGFVTHRVVTRRVRRRLAKMKPEELKTLQLETVFARGEALPASLVNNPDVTVAQKAKALVLNWEGFSPETRKIALAKAVGGFDGTFGELMKVSQQEFMKLPGVEKVETVLSTEQRTTISSIETLLGQLPEGLFEEFEGLYKEVRTKAALSLEAFEKAQALQHSGSEFYERLRSRVEQDNIRLLGLLNDLDVLTESLKVDSFDEVTAGVGYLKQASVSISPKLKL